MACRKNNKRVCSYKRKGKRGYGKGKSYRTKSRKSGKTKTNKMSGKKSSMTFRPNGSNKGKGYYKKTTVLRDKFGSFLDRFHKYDPKVTYKKDNKIVIAGKTYTGAGKQSAFQKRNQLVKQTRAQTLLITHKGDLADALRQRDKYQKEGVKDKGLLKQNREFINYNKRIIAKYRKVADNRERLLRKREKQKKDVDKTLVMV